MRFTKFIRIGFIVCLIYVLSGCATPMPGRQERMEYLYAPAFQKIIDYEIQKLERERNHNGQANIFEKEWDY